MASPNATFTELVTTTLRNHPSEVADNVSNHNALYRRISSRGNIETVSGGYEIVRPLDYAENSTYQRYSGYDTLNIGQSNVLSAAKYEWKQAAVHVTASGRELRMNSGREQIINLSRARIQNARRTAGNNMSVDIYSTGALSNQIGGLQAMITVDGTGTIGGIDASVYPFWRNQFKDGGSISAANIEGSMNELWLDCTRGTDQPDLIVSSNEIFAFYWASQQDKQRYTSPREGNAGFTSLKYVGADVIHDGGSGIADNRMYFLNTDYLYLTVHRAANWAIDEEKMSVNQDAVVIPLLWMGNLVTSNRARQGVLFT